MYKTIKVISAVAFISIFSHSYAFSAVRSAQERLSLINSSMDKIESAELRGAVLTDVDTSEVKIPVPTRSIKASQFAHQMGKAARGASGSAVAEGWQNAFKVSGELRLAMGIEDENVFGMTADGNLNERNWRLINDKGLNRMENTFDPGVYSRLKVVLDAVIQESVRMHLNVTVDPWSYVGKSDPVTVQGAYGRDEAVFQYLAWGNTPYVIAQSVRTKRLGNTSGVGELKIRDDRVEPTSAVSRGPWYDIFYIPETDIDYTFNPLRELWFDFKTGDKGYVRVFPMAYDNQALTSDDPLHLSNNKSYWEESPWLRDWAKGTYNPDAATPSLTPQPSFTKGKWDRALANLSRDSDGQWLTALRGVALDMKTNEDGTLKAVVATPKNLWQEYGDVTAVPGSIRLKQFLADRLFVGFTGNMHIGLVNNDTVDSENYVKSIDAGFLPMDGMKITAQASASDSTSDETNSYYESRKRGEAYFAAVELFSTGVDVLTKDYFGVLPAKGEGTFAKTRLYVAKMEKSFESSLSNYHATRDDAFWSRHLTFYPSPYRYLPGSLPAMSHYDLEPFAIGNGIDYGRQVVGWRADLSFFDDRLKGLGDSRYVMSSEKGSRKIESVSRTQWEYQATDKLITKMLLLHHGLPKTIEGKDPFITLGETGEPVVNTAVKGGEDPSLNTGTLGARYQVTDWLAWNGVWERTNDFTVATNNYPNGVLTDGGYGGTYVENGRVYTMDVPFLYSQSYFDQAPYRYHSILKTGLEFKPTDRWDIYLDYARNPNKFSGNIDDNYNHYGIESSYRLTAKWGIYGRYTYSRMYDLNRLVNDHVLDYQPHHNFYVETRYCHTKDSKLSVMYGVGPTYNIAVQGVNPSMAYYSSPSVDTQHIVRILYQQKF